MFKKILIANRGEIALRIIRTAREMGIKTVAVYSNADAHSLHVAVADEAVCIGPASSLESYLKVSNLLSAAEITNADAIHPGYGFLAENAYFSAMCEKHQIKFIGALPEHIEQMGNKSMAKDTMKKAGIPCIPGSDGAIYNYEQAQEIAKKIGYPLRLKASAGGGGKGMRAIWKASEFKNAWEVSTKEAKNAFGNEEMYIEKLLVNPRHIEIQIASDRYGKTIHFSERDCSIQRRHQKLLEETPSPFLTEALRDKMGKAAVRVGEFISYEGVGTVEFLVDEKGNFYFMEMNTRIQVEHPITEEVTGCDLIREQILIAYGERLSSSTNYYPKGHSIECRINVEDPCKNFRPFAGKIKNIHLPGGRGVRVDTHIHSNYEVPPYYDSMIAKLIVKAENRKEAIRKMEHALEEFLIEGVPTTIGFHKQLMRDKNFLEGNYTTKFLEDFKIDPSFYEHSTP